MSHEAQSGPTVSFRSARKISSYLVSAKVEQLQGKFQRNEICMQQHFYVHFYSEGHNRFLGNISISLIYKIDGF